MEKSKKTSRQERREKRKNRRGFITFLLSAFVLCVAVNVAMSFNDRLETMIIRTGTEEESIAAEGYLFREQTVIPAQTAGYLYCVKDEEQRVKTGETLAYIYKNEINSTAMSEIKSIDKEIAKLETGSQKKDIYSNDAAKIEQSIAGELGRIFNLAYRGHLDEIEIIKDEVNGLIEDRRIITGAAQPKDNVQELEILKQKKTTIEAEYNIERTLVHSPATGVFTSRVDGLEEMLEPEYLDGITPEYIAELNKKTVKTESEAYVESGWPIGKIVNNFTWSVAALVPVDMAEDMNVGDSIDVRFPDVDIRTIRGTVSKISSAEKGYVVVVVESNKYIDKVYSSSKVKVELIKHHHEGYKIPSKSIRIIDGRAGVYVIRNNKARFMPVEIIYNSKEWVIADEKADENSSIKLYDELIISGKDLYDNKVVR